MVVKPDKKTKFLVRCCEMLVFVRTKMNDPLLTSKTGSRIERVPHLGVNLFSHLNCIYICRKRIPLLLFLINIGFFRISTEFLAGKKHQEEDAFMTNSLKT